MQGLAGSSITASPSLAATLWCRGHCGRAPQKQRVHAKGFLIPGALRRKEGWNPQRDPSERICLIFPLFHPLASSPLSQCPSSPESLQQRPRQEQESHFGAAAGLLLSPESHLAGVHAGVSLHTQTHRAAPAAAGAGSVLPASPRSTCLFLWGAAEDEDAVHVGACTLRSRY